MIMDEGHIRNQPRNFGCSVGFLRMSSFQSWCHKMVKSIMRSVGEIERPNSDRHGGRELGYRHEERRQEPPAHRSSERRDQEFAYSYIKPLTLRKVSSRDVIRSLSATVDEALQVFRSLQSSFAEETSQLSYVESQILDYVWEDKLNFVEDRRKREAKSQQSGNGDTTQFAGGKDAGGVRAITKKLRLWLDEAIKATADETKRSAGDNRSLVEKLSNSARDIENSLKHIWNKRKEMDALITDLEILCVLLKRHGGIDGDSGLGGKGRNERVPLSRGNSYEHARVNYKVEDGSYESRDDNDGGDDVHKRGRTEHRGGEEPHDDCQKGVADRLEWGAQGTCSHESLAPSAKSRYQATREKTTGNW